MGEVEVTGGESMIGLLVDTAMREIECANPSMKEVLSQDYGLPSLDKRLLGQLVDMISDIEVGDRKPQSKYVLGRVYESFLSMFASPVGSFTSHTASWIS